MEMEPVVEQGFQINVFLTECRYKSSPDESAPLEELNMRIRNLWAVATLCGGIAMFGTAQADQTQVTKWPDDVPCSAVSKNPDGSYTLLVDVILGDGSVMASGNTFPSLAEYNVWVTKCG